MMLGCDRFQVEEEKGPEHHFRRSFVVTFWNSSSSSSEDGEHLLGSTCWVRDTALRVDL